MTKWYEEDLNKAVTQIAKAPDKPTIANIEPATEKKIRKTGIKPPPSITPANIRTRAKLRSKDVQPYSVPIEAHIWEMVKQLTEDMEESYGVRISNRQLFSKALKQGLLDEYERFYGKAFEEKLLDDS